MAGDDPILPSASDSAARGAAAKAAGDEAAEGLAKVAQAGGPAAAAIVNVKVRTDELTDAQKRNAAALDQMKRGLGALHSKFNSVAGIGKLWKKRLEEIADAQDSLSKTVEVTSDNIGKASEKLQRHIDGVRQGYRDAGKLAEKYNVSLEKMDKTMKGVRNAFMFQISAYDDLQGTQKELTESTHVMSRAFGVDASKMIDYMQSRLQNSNKTLMEVRNETMLVTKVADSYSQKLKALGKEAMRTGNIFKEDLLKNVMGASEAFKFGNADIGVYAKGLSGLIIEGQKSGLNPAQIKDMMGGMTKMLDKMSSQKLDSVFSVLVTEGRLEEVLSKLTPEELEKFKQAKADAGDLDLAGIQEKELIIEALRGTAGFNEVLIDEFRKLPGAVQYEMGKESFGSRRAAATALKSIQVGGEMDKAFREGPTGKAAEEGKKFADTQKELAKKASEAKKAADTFFQWIQKKLNSLTRWMEQHLGVMLVSGIASVTAGLVSIIAPILLVNKNVNKSRKEAGTHYRREKRRSIRRNRLLARIASRVGGRGGGGVGGGGGGGRRATRVPNRSMGAGVPLLYTGAAGVATTAGGQRVEVDKNGKVLGPAAPATKKGAPPKTPPKQQGGGGGKAAAVVTGLAMLAANWDSITGEKGLIRGGAPVSDIAYKGVGGAYETAKMGLMYSGVGTPAALAMAGIEKYGGDLHEELAGEAHRVGGLLGDDTYGQLQDMERRKVMSRGAITKAEERQYKAAITYVKNFEEGNIEMTDASRKMVKAMRKVAEKLEQDKGLGALYEEGKAEADEMTNRARQEAFLDAGDDTAGLAKIKGMKDPQQRLRALVMKLMGSAGGYARYSGGGKSMVDMLKGAQPGAAGWMEKDKEMQAIELRGMLAQAGVDPKLFKAGAVSEANRATNIFRGSEEAMRTGKKKLSQAELKKWDEQRRKLKGKKGVDPNLYSPLTAGIGVIDGVAASGGSGMGAGIGNVGQKITIGVDETLSGVEGASVTPEYSETSDEIKFELPGVKVRMGMKPWSEGMAISQSKNPAFATSGSAPGG